jgi:ATP-dependent protease ClpP protease subunit
VALKVKVLLRIKDPKGNVRLEVKQSADSQTGIIRIIGEIDWYSNNANDFRNALDQMKANGVVNLKCYINSPGGSVMEANEIYNLIIAFCPEENRSVDIGSMCASAATTIAGAFPQKNTRAFKNVIWMMHNNQIGIQGEEKDLLSYATLLGNLDAAYRKRWAARMGVTEKFLKTKLDAEWWLTSEDLKTYNVISSVIDEDDKVPVDARNVFNRIVTNKIPEAINKTLPASVEEIAEQEKQTLKNKMKNLFLLLIATLPSLKAYLTNENATDAEITASLAKAFNEKDAEIAKLNNSVTA